MLLAAAHRASQELRVLCADIRGFCTQWEYEDEYDDSFDAYDGGGAADGVADAEGVPQI